MLDKTQALNPILTKIGMEYAETEAEAFREWEKFKSKFAGAKWFLSDGTPINPIPKPAKESTTL